MTGTETIMEQENVNGVKLTLKVNKRQNSPTSRQFTISYKNVDKSSLWPKMSLFLAIIFNITALIYVRISLTALLVIIIVFSVIVIFWVTHSVQSESLLVIPTVGIQSSIKYVCGKEDNFVPWSSIDDVIINEVIKLNRVLYYLTLLVKQHNQGATDSEAVKLIPLFKFTKPRLLMLERIYSELQSLLVDAQKEVAMGSGDKG
ncbi:unnamed protein product [Arctia plantaginis]|uniref:Phosphatidylinositol N-acetylglucosaminyltransferase subunit H conserved domain-containing protein n=1 Tax=Arctia plantaginis TaxID=874455 RepID=A0A8S1AQX6_ARCPL|nr:unnamed protein product [Arctia plantaginis]CAB3248979.1 unnamed protein product [Arctia plantaginis]